MCQSLPWCVHTLERYHTSSRINLCSKTPFRILAIVIAAIITNAPTRNPCAHASKTSPFGDCGFSEPAVGTLAASTASPAAVAGAILTCDQDSRNVARESSLWLPLAGCGYECDGPQIVGGGSLSKSFSRMSQYTIRYGMSCCFYSRASHVGCFD
jgi:hypothetical protein